MARRETMTLQLLLLGISCYIASAAVFGDQHHSRSVKTGLSKSEEDGSMSLSDAVELLRESLLEEEKRIEVPNSEGDTCQLDDFEQGCLLNCIAESLDCASTCDSSKKYTSVANVINELTFSCAQKKSEECSNDWIVENINHDDESCMSDKKLLSSLATCKCTGKPLSNPLDPYNPTSCPGALDVDSSLGNFNRPKSEDLCFGESGDLVKRGPAQPYTDRTAKLKSCGCNSCGYHGYSYKWCYTCPDSWDYCCSGACDFYGYSYKWCNSGNTWDYCSD